MPIYRPENESIVNNNDNNNNNSSKIAQPLSGRAGIPNLRPVKIPLPAATGDSWELELRLYQLEFSSGNRHFKHQRMRELSFYKPVGWTRGPKAVNEFLN